MPAPLACALLAAAVLVVSTLAGPGPSLSNWLGDPDDALRLATVRDLLAGAPWFDTTLPRVGAPEPLVSHWSRLIDAPLAASIGALSPFFGAEPAELATRMLWPVLLFLSLALVVTHEAQRRAGPLGAVFATILVATSAAALAQFKPGRIDHHNAQILCAVAGLIFLARSATDRRAGWIAGMLIGLGLAIGYEAIALLLPTLAIAALAAVWQPRAGAGIARAAAAATAVLFAALALTVAPLQWFDVRCDALSVNLAVFAAFATGGLWIARAGASLIGRVAVLGVGVACGGLLYAGIEPACLAGPFGQVDAALGPIWLDHVSETSSLLWLGAKHPAAALAAGSFVAAGVMAQAALWRERRDPSDRLAAIVVAVAFPLALWQLKFLPYACWLAAVPIAVWAARLNGRASLSPSIIRLAAVVLLSEATLDGAFSALISPFRQSAIAVAEGAEPGDPRRPCFRSANVHTLAALPLGLILADIDLGSYIVALSPHRVVAAPYHRLAKGILANQAILSGSPSQALKQLETLRVDYVALCADQAGGRHARLDGRAPLQARLLSGEHVDGLVELPTSSGAAIRVWKVARGS